MKSQITYSSDGKSLIKICRSETECANELHVYNLGLDFTPKLLNKIDEKTIEISYIKGNSLKDEIDFDFSKPAEQLAKLHKSTIKEGIVLCHLDNNPRNYLIEKETGKFYLIDFSESGYSLPENDLVNFLLFWAAILPPNRFQNAMQRFLEGYKSPELLDNKRQRSHFSQWINVFDVRRRKYCKNPGTKFAWQIDNRKYLLTNFYTLVRSDKK
ncbi:MAG: phosphotransferase [Candidatus Cloacimonetes bacterium]|nr:phosphotransferase [Candidatus Cloacimonadota bacterium]